jgi:hypothetical protein
MLDENCLEANANTAADAEAVAQTTTECVPLPLGPPGKLTGYDFYRHIGSPKLLVAPMVRPDEPVLTYLFLGGRIGVAVARVLPSVRRRLVLHAHDSLQDDARLP